MVKNNNNKWNVKNYLMKQERDNNVERSLFFKNFSAN
jgi:hypothetical protein